MQTGERYLDCHIHVNVLVSRRIQAEAGGCGCDNQWTCVIGCLFIFIMNQQSEI